MVENFRELLKYSSLIKALVIRHLAIRYRGSVLGFVWSFLNPLCLMLVYMLVFKYYIRFDSVDNYTIFLFCGLLPWLWIQSALIEGTSSIVSSGHLITKSMFPAHVLPVVATLTSLIHYVLSLPLLFLFMILWGMEIHFTIIFLPLLLVLQFLFLHGVNLGLSALNVHYRDVQHIVVNFLTFLFFLCPILYPIDTVPEKFRFTLEYNPLALFTSFYHDLILNGKVPSAYSLLYVLIFVIVVLAIGNKIFDHYRESFAEML